MVNNTPNLYQFTVMYEGWQIIALDCLMISLETKYPHLNSLWVFILYIVLKI